MTAIWPAGPPNVCSEMANQARTAVRNGIAGSDVGLPARGVAGHGRLLAHAGSRPSSVRRRWNS